MIDLILSLDYEIFGNGSGDVRCDMIDPTRRLLDICEAHGAKLTIMFEAAEYWAFERYDQQLRNDLDYSPAELMREQAVEAIRSGHDVQLHLHPQWVGAVYEGGQWRLQDRYWRLADLPDGLGEKGRMTSITGILHAGKQTLDDMLQAVRSDYECMCFRAGGFYAQPSHEIIRALKRVGLRVDSSVVEGYRCTWPFEVDYSDVRTDKPCWWTTETELVAEGKPGENILEIPVACKMEPYWSNLKPAAFRAALQRRRAERASRRGLPQSSGRRPSSVPSPAVFLRRMMTRYASRFDFCKLSCRDMLRRLSALDGSGRRPVVMIGHSKDFLNDKHLGDFLAVVSRDSLARFANMAEAAREVLDASPCASVSSEAGDAST